MSQEPTSWEKSGIVNPASNAEKRFDDAVSGLLSIPQEKLCSMVATWIIKVRDSKSTSEMLTADKELLKDIRLAAIAEVLIRTAKPKSSE